MPTLDRKSNLFDTIFAQETYSNLDGHKVNEEVNRNGSHQSKSERY